MAGNPILICDVSHSFFSIARYSGGARIQGEEYVYCPNKDLLIKKDWFKYYKKLQWEEFIEAVKSGQKPILSKKQPKTKSEKDINTTPSLFD